MQWQFSKLEKKKKPKNLARFVMNNRDRHYTDYHNELCNHDCKYDIVIGPAANDDLAMLFRQFSAGNISIETMISEMEYRELTNQYSFHTEIATRILNEFWYMEGA